MLYRMPYSVACHLASQMLNVLRRCYYYCCGTSRHHYDRNQQELGNYRYAPVSKTAKTARRSSGDSAGSRFVDVTSNHIIHKSQRSGNKAAVIAENVRMVFRIFSFFYSIFSKGSWCEDFALEAVCPSRRPTGLLKGKVKRLLVPSH